MYLENAIYYLEFSLKSIDVRNCNFKALDNKHHRKFKKENRILINTRFSLNIVMLI